MCLLCSGNLFVLLGILAGLLGVLSLVTVVTVLEIVIFSVCYTCVPILCIGVSSTTDCTSCSCAWVWTGVLVIGLDCSDDWSGGDFFFATNGRARD